jgi:L-rhamnose mutarotase
MDKSNKFAWTWTVKAECVDEYVKMHRDTWDEVLKEHSAAGITNYSIFQNGNQFFYCFECNDVNKAFKYLDASPICKKWNSITSKMMENPFDFGKENPLVFLNEIFYLK